MGNLGICVYLFACPWAPSVRRCLGPPQRHRGARGAPLGVLLRDTHIEEGAYILFGTLLLSSLLYHVIWIRRSRRRERQSQRSNKLDELRRGLVLHFAPLVAVDSYQFKGMTETKCGVTLDFQDLGLTLKNGGRRVLDGVTGRFERGKMIAIMGPSGSGKTTFMNTLCGKATYGNVTGTVTINGRQGKMNDLKPIMGFVPQDDVVHERLTVREQLEMSAKLRNDYRTTRQDLKDIVEDVLHVLQVQHIQRSIVGGVDKRGISGGQRKRVNIGLELAACPTVLFLDEPTSGLDSTSSLMVVSSLKKMTTLGMTNIMVIHQPRYSLFALFDQVLLLGTGGRTVYSGRADKALPYFEGLGFERPPADNPADWMMDVISGQVKNLRSAESNPVDLFDRWAEASGRPESPSSPEDGHALRTARLVQEHSHLVGTEIVRQEWNRVDTVNSGYLGLKGFHKLVKNCCDVDPDRKIVAMLADQISAAGRIEKMGSMLGSERFGVHVRRDDFAKFLRLSQEELVAGHRHIQSDGSPQGDSGDSSDDLLTEDGLERRVFPGPCRQWAIMAHARMVQFWRGWMRRLLDMIMVIFCATAFALVGRGEIGSPIEISMYQTGLALLIPISVLPTFADRPIFWRMSSAGTNIMAYYMSRFAVSIIDALMLSLAYTMTYYLVARPGCPVSIYLDPALYLAWSVAATGYLLSIAVPPESATLTTLVLMLAFTQVLGKFDTTLNWLNANVQWKVVLLSFVPTRWSTEMQFVRYVEHNDGVAMPNPPDCSDMQDSSVAAFTDCLPLVADCITNQSVAVGATVLALQCEKLFERCAAGHYSSKKVSQVFQRIMGYFTAKGMANYQAWAYHVYTHQEGTCSWLFHRYGCSSRWCHTYSPAANLLLQGLLGHILAILCLARQVPGSASLRDCCCCCCRRRHDARALVPADEPDELEDTEEDGEGEDGGAPSPAPSSRRGEPRSPSAAGSTARSAPWPAARSPSLVASSVGTPSPSNGSGFRHLAAARASPTSGPVRLLPAPVPAGLPATPGGCSPMSHQRSPASLRQVPLVPVSHPGAASPVGLPSAAATRVPNLRLTH
ncbi:unnamed protein product [Prorocentrum cordatum]|uniref:ABC transporter domain-containing protein n=1 Tax=Prorocentrum cordatum TaxID=2364126 RepID=A0ABN9TC28_9DINO|nr:unnamed protein product [Polarella glacialis]